MWSISLLRSGAAASTAPPSPLLSSEPALAAGVTSTSSSGLTLLNSSVTGGTYSANSLRCPSGCAFRVLPTPGSLRGFNIDPANIDAAAAQLTTADAPSSTPSLPAPSSGAWSLVGLVSDPVQTPPLPLAKPGSVRLELKLTADFGSEDLLLVQQELCEQLAGVLGTMSERLAVVESYGAGMYFIVDVLPASLMRPEVDDVASGGTPEELLTRLLSLASDLSSSLFEARVLGMLDELKRLDGYGGGSEETLATDLQQAGLGAAKFSILDVLKLVVFTGGVLLAAGLVVGICYGTCVQSAGGEKIEAIVRKPLGGAGGAGRKNGKPADKGTPEEKRSLAQEANDDEEEDEEDEEAGEVVTRCTGSLRAVGEGAAEAVEARGDGMASRSRGASGGGSVAPHAAIDVGVLVGNSLLAVGGIGEERMRMAIAAAAAEGAAEGAAEAAAEAGVLDAGVELDAVQAKAMDALSLDRVSSVIVPPPSHKPLDLLSGGLD